MATPPRSIALSGEKTSLNRPIGVLAIEQITGFMASLSVAMPKWYPCPVVGVVGPQWRATPKARHTPTRRKGAGFVRGGGAVRGMAHQGALSVLVKAGIPIDCVAGCSARALLERHYVPGYLALPNGRNWGEVR